MKYLKVVVPLLFVVALLSVAMPISADQPGTNEDPFGGPPSRGSGDGTSPRKAIFNGGIWAGTTNLDAATSERPRELQNCATLNIPAGPRRWFKSDTWRNARLDITVQDQPQWGAATGYFSGTNEDQTGVGRDGLLLVVYDPDNLRPNFAFPAPNAALLTVNVSGSGGALRSFSGGEPRGISVFSISGHIVAHGRNSNRPDVLLFAEGRWDGWVYYFVLNLMPWNQDIKTCTIRIRD